LGRLGIHAVERDNPLSAVTGNLVRNIAMPASAQKGKKGARTGQARKRRTAGGHLSIVFRLASAATIGECTLAKVKTHVQIFLYSPA